MITSRHISLLVTSGSGPAECQQAVAGVLEAMRIEAELIAVDFDTNGVRTKHGYKSVVVLVSGADAEAFAMNWRGTIQWRAQSNLRPTHKRANWFIGVFDLPAPVQTPDRIHARDVAFETFRAGGPGGQHQNTTDSAVRATHKPTGLSAVAREERSQHRNKSLALERLQHLIAAQAAADEAAQKAGCNELHYALERGNPARCFKGRDFREVKGG
ncbi:peptide chain release factor H [Ruegeria arenilitoris]|uniref:peptide chain release factor H n=1 Tax=Ruegeria arenilitoris TaxID=1173585 RepID=UPI00147AB1BE|nr:peptide chain release factor H [Ruegeria arenilitoris]